VIINGKVVLDKGVFRTIDEEKELANAVAASYSLLKRMGHSVAKNQRPVPGSTRL
jgi:hypothetical protein